MMFMILLVSCGENVWWDQNSCVVYSMAGGAGCVVSCGGCCGLGWFGDIGLCVEGMGSLSSWRSGLYVESVCKLNGSS